MTVGRLTQAGAEALSSVSPAARLSQAGLEVLSSAAEFNTHGRLTQAGMEVLSNNAVKARLTHAGLEVLSSVAEPISAYTFTYTAGTGGTISGSTPQTVGIGDDGSTVTAVANPGYYFVAWSDGVETYSRRDLNASSDITVSAIFAADVRRTPDDPADYRGYPEAYEPVVSFAALPAFQKALVDTELEAIRVFLSHTRRLLSYATSGLDMTQSASDAIPQYWPTTDFSDSAYSQAKLLAELDAIGTTYAAIVQVLRDAAALLDVNVGRFPAVFARTSDATFDAGDLDSDLVSLEERFARVRSIIVTLWRDDWKVW